MKIIALYNVKGGVGKSAAAVNFAYLSANASLKTLLWDLDPQGASTFCLHKKETGLTFKDLIKGKEKLSDHIIKTTYKNLHLIPADFSLRNTDSILDRESKSRHVLYDALAELVPDYDIIWLDCPPGISKLAENIFYASNLVVVPVIPSKLSLRSFQQILHFIEQKDFKPDRIVAFFSMVDMRRNIHKNSIPEIRQKLPNICFNFVPYLSDIEKMSENRKPVAFSKPASRAALAYADLCREVLEKTSIHIGE